MTKTFAHRRSVGWTGLLLALTMLALLSGCGGGNDAPPSSEGSATLDAAGGEVLGPDGVKLAIQPNALIAATTFRIARDGSGAPEMGGVTAISPVYAITPHGTAFAESARISIPFNPADVTPGTQPVLLKAEPGGNWTALDSNVVGNSVSAADTPSLSFFAVGTCQTVRLTNIPGLDPLLYCPAAHTLKLTLQDSNGAELPTPTYASGSLKPALTIESASALRYTVQWTRPRGVVRADRINVSLQGAGLQPAQQPLRDFSTAGNFTQTFTTTIDPASVPGASASGGVVIRLKASADYTTDAFYPGCLCMRPASWTFDTEIPVRVIYRGTQPVITQQPQNQSVVAGQPASFSVAATGSSLSVQWLVTRSGATTDIAGATANSYALASTAVADSGAQYSARVCSARGTPVQQCIASNPAMLSVTAAPVAPVFSTQPQTLAVVEGQTASLSAVASGQPAPQISWFQVIQPRGAPQTLEPVTACPPTAPGRGTTTSATCNLGTLTLASNGLRYIAAANNGVGADVISSAATVNVSPVPVAPAITSPAEPRDQTGTAGGSVSWTVAASGTAPLSYRWRTVAPSGTAYANNVCAGGVNPGQSSSATLTLVNLPVACDGYRFQALVSNSVAPEAASRQAVLTVLPATAAPQITTPLAARSVLNNSQVTFNVIATGSPATFSYAWTLGGGAVPRVVAGCGAADAACTLTAQLADSGKPVAVSVSNGVAPAATSSALLTVTTGDVAASITQQPNSQTIALGGTTSFTIASAGTPTPTVTWQTSIDGTTWVSAGSGSTLTFSNATLAQSGLQVRAIASNTIATVNGQQPATATSNIVTLTVTSGASSPDLLACESFDYAAGDRAAGKTGGIGWSAPWGVTDGDGNSVADTQGGTINGGLSYTDSSGNALIVSGGALKTSAGQRIQLRRATTVNTGGAAGSTRWLSLLIKRADSMGFPAAAGALLGTNNRPATGGYYGGIAADPVRATVNCMYCVPSAPNGALLNNFGPGSVAMVLIRYEVGARGVGSGMSMWINPPLDPSVALPAPTDGPIVANVDDLTNGLSLMWDGANSFVLDEIRVATTRAAATPFVAVPPGALTAAQIVAHAGRSLVVRADGSAWAFGQYTDPVTGGYPNTSVPARPVKVAGLPLVQQVAIGATYNSWALARNGEVWGWGFINSVKAFGQGPSNSAVTFPSPVRVLMAANTPIDRVCQIAGTMYGVVMVRSDVPGGSCAANEARSVWFTGESISSNEVGGNYATRFDRLGGDGAPGGLPLGRWIVEVFTSRDHGSNVSTIFARANDGSVYAWGYNAGGLLGVGNTDAVTVPTLAPGWQGTLRIVATGEATLALMADGSIKGVGNNINASLGIGLAEYRIIATPTLLAAPTGATDLSGASSQPSSMALVGGQLRYWGSSTRFAAGVQVVPVAVNSAAAPFTAVAVAAYHALTIGPGNAVYAWGDWQSLGCGNYLANVCDNTQVPQLVRLP